MSPFVTDRAPSKSSTLEGRIDGRDKQGLDRPPHTVTSDTSAADSGSAGSRLLRKFNPCSQPAPAQRFLTIGANLVGAGSTAVFSYSFLHFYVQTHRLIGIVFFGQQTLVAHVYLIRRPARLVSRRLDDWLLAFRGTFAAVLFRLSAQMVRSVSPVRGPGPL
jgi:hypothetical protein